MKKMIRWFLLIVSWFMFASMSHALTLQNIIDKVRPNIQDTDTTNPAYTDGYIADLANDAQREINNMTWCTQTSTSIALTANTTYYALPGDFVVDLQVVYYDPDGRTVDELEKKTERKLFMDTPAWERGPAADPINYIIAVPAAGSAASRLGLYPPPGSSSTGTVKMWYVTKPTAMSATSDQPFNGIVELTQYHNMIPDYVIMRVKMIEGKTAEADYYGKMFAQKLDVMNQRLGYISNYRPSPSPSK